MKVLILVALLLMPIAASAQAAPVKIPFTRGIFTWGHVIAAGSGTPSEFRVKCGVATGAYTITKVFLGADVRRVALNQVIPAPGTYFCAVSAANAFGESPMSAEVNFEAGQIPGAITDLTIGAQ